MTRVQSQGENEFQLSMMYDQTGSRISLNNELSSLEDTQWKQPLKSRSVKSFLIRRLDKYVRTKCVDISRKALTAHEQIPVLTNTEFIKCNHRLVYVWVWHIEKEVYISFWQYRCNSEFSVFLTFELGFIILFWDTCDLLDRVCWPRCWFVSDKPNLFKTIVSAFEFKEITKVQNAHIIMPLEDNETRPRGCTTVRAC